MTFAALPAAATVFLDANTIVYHFSRHARYGAACTDLLELIAPGTHRLHGQPCSQ
jgi:hypothetical protein